MQPVHTFQFDIYQRYALLAQILEAAFPDNGSPIHLLDYGCGASSLTRHFLPDRFSITRADVESFAQDDIVVVRPGEPLPFKDSEFDVVIALDVLEHIPRAGRPFFVNECTRLASDLVVLCFPEGNAEVQAAEAQVADLALRMFRKPIDFLDEHKAYVLPTASEVEGLLQERSFSSARIANSDLALWHLYSVLDLAFVRLYGLSAQKDELNSWVNLRTTPVATRLAYRSFVLASQQPDLLVRLVSSLNGAEPDSIEEAELGSKISAYVAQFVSHYSELEDVILAKDRHIEDLSALAQRQYAEMSEMVDGKEKHILSLNESIAGVRSSLIDQCNELKSQIAESENQIQAMRNTIAERDERIRELDWFGRIRRVSQRLLRRP